METTLPFHIEYQPDDSSCGPTCLHSIYHYFGDPITQRQVIEETPQLEEGGTLAVFLGCHALRRGYQATIYTYNLEIFDPSWFSNSNTDIAQKLRLQRECKDRPKLHLATQGYLDFIQLGGRLRYEDLRAGLIRKYLKKSIPILTGLSATYLYGIPREIGAGGEYDDLRGEPSGHFVVLCGYEKKKRQVLMADPSRPEPLLPQKAPIYWVGIERLISAIMLGILTYDSNLLIIEPKQPDLKLPHVEAKPL